MEGLAGKTAIVTGGSRGIGRGICQCLAKRKMNVVFSYLNSEKDADTLCKKLESGSYRVLGIKSDIRKKMHSKKLMEKTLDAFGELHFIVNNAGVVNPVSLAFMSENAWDEVLDTNLKGMYYLTQMGIQYFLKKKQPASIVNISSLTGLLGTEGQSNYAASKGGMIAFTRSVAREIAPYNIRINSIVPGLIDTDMIHAIPDDKLDSFLQRIPMKRFGNAEEIGNLVAFLLSDLSSYMTGSIVFVDGGFGA